MNIPFGKVSKPLNQVNFANFHHYVKMTGGTLCARVNDVPRDWRHGDDEQGAHQADNCQQKSIPGMGTTGETFTQTANALS